MTHGIDTGFLIAAEVNTHPEHQAARQVFGQLRSRGDRFALVPQVLAEFIHVVTDAKRFSLPLDMPQALNRAELWWNSPEVDQIIIDGSSISTFMEWMRAHGLGRKRILDTMLAAAFRSAGVTSILTTNARDFAILGDFVCLAPS